MTDFYQLVKDQKARVFNTCLGLVKNFEDAEDLTQEVFIEVYEKLSGFRGESSLQTWIYRIAVNKSLQYIRSKNAKKRSGEIVDLSETSLGSETFDHPGVKMENRELARVLFLMIDRLPENQRLAFTLHKVENLSHEEISEIMEKSRSSVESLIHRAKQSLREMLKTYYEKNG